MTDGVIYAATGAGYVELAEASATSLKASNPSLEIDLYTDMPTSMVSDVFDQVFPSPSSDARAKLDCMPLSRFDRTLYLDCDTLILRSFDDLFDILDQFELALAHDVKRSTPLIQQGFSETTPYAFPQFNSGVVLFRSSDRIRDFFSEWRRRYLDAGEFRDQVTLKDLLWSSDLRFYILPPEFNLRRVTVLDAWEPGDARPTIVHSHRFLDHLKNPAAERVSSFKRLLEVERIALAEEWGLEWTPEEKNELSELLDGLAGKE